MNALARIHPTPLHPSRKWKAGLSHRGPKPQALHISRRGAAVQALSRDRSSPACGWPTFLSSLFASGAVGGTLLDGIHSRTGLQIYEISPVDIGGLHTSLAVPPLLGCFYVVLGCLFVLADSKLQDQQTTKVINQCRDARVIVAGFAVLAADLQLSAWLYSTGVPFGQISLALAVASVGTWTLFDGTRQGVGLAALCAMGAPLSEVVLLKLVPLWSYPNADLDLGTWGGFVSWVPWCYCFYAPVLGALARYLWHASDDADPVEN